MDIKYKHIFFDFDGVLAESNAVRIEGFRMLFKEYDHDSVGRLIEYVSSNAGKSRFDKINYFFKEVLKQEIDSKELLNLAGNYSKIVKQKVIDSLPVRGSVEFLSANYREFNFVIVSNSEQEELREICAARQVSRFFKKILGSPRDKKDNVSFVLSENCWDKNDCLLIGDSIEDLAAAEFNGVNFIARDSGLIRWDCHNNPVRVIKDFTELSSNIGGVINEKNSNNNCT